MSFFTDLTAKDLLSTAVEIQKAKTPTAPASPAQIPQPTMGKGAAGEPIESKGSLKEPWYANKPLIYGGAALLLGVVGLVAYKAIK